MKKLLLNINLIGVELQGEDKTKTPTELCTLIIKNVIVAHGANSRGLLEEDRRKFYKISDSFEEALKAKKLEVELEDDWFGFIKKCFRETPLQPNPLLRKVEEAVASVENR